jgi:hypothetical protein
VIKRKEFSETNDKIELYGKRCSAIAWRKERGRMRQYFGREGFAVIKP